VPPVALFDTNIWVSALLNPSGTPARLLEQWVTGRVTIVISLPLLEELRDVLNRPRLRRKYGLQDKDIGALLRLLAARSRLVPITSRIRVCRDPDDNVVIETAIDGGAAYIVTGDDDLKRDRTVRRYLHRHKIRVMTVDRFLALITRRPFSR
jgi:putative PIN family toxin of toxin-antitoxin system